MQFEGNAVWVTSCIADTRETDRPRCICIRYASGTTCAWLCTSWARYVPAGSVLESLYLFLIADTYERSFVRRSIARSKKMDRVQRHRYIYFRCTRRCSILHVVSVYSGNEFPKLRNTRSETNTVPIPMVELYIYIHIYIYIYFLAFS